MTEVARFDESEADGITELLVGRKIVQVEMGNFEVPGSKGWSDEARGRMTLDTGYQIYVRPNQGGCACSAGDYELDKLTAVDNIITSVRLLNDPDGDDHYSDEGEHVGYRIYVLADAVEINAVSISGSDGNGYYGTGYELIVVAP